MTAIEWLIETLNKKYGNDDFIITFINEIEQAKEMEKQQIIDARVKKPLESEWLEAEQYYNETFKTL